METRSKKRVFIEKLDPREPLKLVDGLGQSGRDQLIEGLYQRGYISSNNTENNPEFAEFNSPLDFVNVDELHDFAFMFKDCINFNQDLSMWNVSNGTHFDFMFFKAIRFNGNITTWSTINGTSFKGMFGKAYCFNQDISNWIVSRGTTFGFMFISAIDFNSDLSGWDVSSGTDFSFMFARTYHFDIDLSRWDVSRGQKFNSMFCEALDFNQDISSWDVSNGTNFKEMFYGAVKFNQNLSNWDIKSTAYMSNMFKCDVFSRNLMPIAVAANQFKLDLMDEYNNLQPMPLMQPSGNRPNAETMGFDVINGDVKVFEFLKRDGNFAILCNKVYTLWNKYDIIREYLYDGTAVIYECFTVDSLHPENMGNIPYFNIARLSHNAVTCCVLFSQLKTVMTDPTIKVFEFIKREPERILSSTVSYNVKHNVPGTTRVSAAHCQEGMHSTVYDIHKVNMDESMDISVGGKKPRRHKKRTTAKKPNRHKKRTTAKNN